MNPLEQIGDDIIDAVSRGGAAELLDAITRPEADRAASAEPPAFPSW